VSGHSHGSGHVSKVPTGDIEMKEVAIECANYVFFLPPTLAMVASRVIANLSELTRTLN
jgi:hypothetical protein